MNDNAAFSRMNYFEGFFTTAEDWREEQSYHIRKRQYHHRGLQTPGVIRGERDELDVGWRVRKVDGADRNVVEVMPGAALDGLGNYIYLHETRKHAGEKPLLIPQEANVTCYVVMSFGEVKTDELLNLENEDYSGCMRMKEEPVIEVKDEPGDGKREVELARIKTDADGKPIVDRDHVKWAGPVPRYLPEVVRKRLVDVMVDTGEAFGDLADRFPNRPSEDVRHVALTLRMLAELEELGKQKLAAVVVNMLGGIEEKVHKALGPILSELYGIEQTAVKEKILARYIDAVTQLVTSDNGHVTVTDLLIRQEEVAAAAKALSKIPEAHAGENQTALTDKDVATVWLDASASKHYTEGIDHYSWDL